MTARRRKSLPSRTLAEVHEAFPKLRQSTMGDFDNCALSALFDLEGYPVTTAEQARGTIFHRYAGKVMKTLWENGHSTISISEALAIFYEACAQRDVPDRDVVWVPSKERRLLRTAAVMLVWNPVKEEPRPFGVDRLIPDGIELRLDAPVRYPESRECSHCRGVKVEIAITVHAGGDEPEVHVEKVDCGFCGGWGRELTGAMVERVVTGQLDALIADPPAGLVVLDWKTPRKAPPKYEGAHRDERGRADGGKVDAGLSYLGYWQQRTYGLLVLDNVRDVQYLTMREVYPLDLDERGNMAVRTSTITREDMDDIRQELATVAELVDRGLMGGSASEVWKPQPGVHCRFCRSPARCPIEPEARGSGRITNRAEAARVGDEAIVAQQVLDVSKKALKPWVEVYGPVEAKSAKGRQVWRFKAPSSGKGRGTFGVFVPEASDRGPEDPAVAGAFAEVKERKKEAMA